MVGLTGCKVNYSFTGANISPDVNTISIATFPNYAPLAQPTLSQVFSESLKDYFVSQTSLSLVKQFGDLTIEGEIKDYRTSPLGISQNETAAENRLTIIIAVRYVNTKDDSQSFEKTFSRFEDYSSAKSLSEVEDDLISLINEQLIQDIFNESVGNW